MRNADDAFEQISPSIFRVFTSARSQEAQGTGFVIGTFRESKRIILATAAHVLDFPAGETISWTVQQFDEHGAVARQVSFQSTADAVGAMSPHRVHKTLDVGVCVLPARGSDGQPLVRPREMPVRAIDPRKGVSTGTRVAWAGFPGIVEAALGFPQLCYFEGVISAMVNRTDKQIYVVDGHGAPGASGGPVWHWSTERDRLEVVGIICNYRHAADGLPGFCFFEPINPVMLLLEEWRQQSLETDFVITQCRD